MASAPPMSRARGWSSMPRGLALAVETPWGRGELDTRLVGAFNAANVLGVLGTLLVSGVEFDAALTMLAEVEAPPGRMQRLGGDALAAGSHRLRAFARRAGKGARRRCAIAVVPRRRAHLRVRLRRRPRSRQATRDGPDRRAARRSRDRDQRQPARRGSRGDRQRNRARHSRDRKPTLCGRTRPRGGDRDECRRSQRRRRRAARGQGSRVLSGACRRPPALSRRPSTRRARLRRGARDDGCTRPRRRRIAATLHGQNAWFDGVTHRFAHDVRRASCSSRSRASASTDTTTSRGHSSAAPWRPSSPPTGLDTLSGQPARRRRSAARAGRARRVLAPRFTLPVDRHRRQQRQDHGQGNDRGDLARRPGRAPRTRDGGQSQQRDRLPLTVLGLRAAHASRRSRSA